MFVIINDQILVSPSQIIFVMHQVPESFLPNLVLLTSGLHISLQVPPPPPPPSLSCEGLSHIIQGLQTLLTPQLHSLQNLPSFLNCLHILPQYVPHIELGLPCKVRKGSLGQFCLPRLLSSVTCMHAVSALKLLLQLISGMLSVLHSPRGLPHPPNLRSLSRRDSR